LPAAVVGVRQRLRVAGEERDIVGEFRGILHNRHQHRPVVVQLQDLAQLQGLTRKNAVVAVDANGDRVGSPEVFQLAKQEPWRGPHQRVIVNSHQQATFQFAIEGAESGGGLEERDGPQHARHTANPPQLGVAERKDGVHVFEAGIHHPDGRLGDIADDRRSPHQHSYKDPHLLVDQQNRDRHSQDQAEIFGPIVKQHLEGNSIHWGGITTTWATRRDVSQAGAERSR
jgi:hypothetical protein